ncbi:MAG: rhodanese-like domain-containing protein [Actinomycetota bacterium]|nr:rhodanese-like domain-containing protein [Actinomycetota bacterium]
MMHRRKGLIALLMALALAMTACGSSTATDTTLDPSSPLASTTTLAGAVDTTEAVATETTEAVEVFDVEAAVIDYAASIPDGWMMVKELEDFKAAVEASDALIIDVRETGEYAEGHIMDAINIPLRTLADNLDKIPTDRQVFVYCKSGWRGGMATSTLAMMGYDNVKGYPAGWVGWTEAGEEVNLEPVEAEVVGDPGLQPELVAAVDEFLNSIPEGWLTAGDAQNVSDAIDAGAFVVDVREPDEFADGHMAGAINVPVRQLGTTDVEFPTDTSMIHYCGSGWRAALATPIIHILGNDNDKGYSSTWASWADEGFPVES